MSRMIAEVISDAKQRIRSAASISLFLDFDGTLVPIVSDPTASQLDADVAETLRLISTQGFLAATIISGRAVEDLYRRVRLPGLIYAGNHGFEIFGRDLRFVEPIASSRREQLETLCVDLHAKLQSFAGAVVEYKGLTATIHYRNALPIDIQCIQEIVSVVVAQAGNLFRVNPGRKVLEILPRADWHKGSAVAWINSHLSQPPDLCIYIGDDTTDEDAFSVLPDALTIKVGSAPITCAQYQLPDPAAVHEFLLWLTTQEPSHSNKGVN